MSGRVRSALAPVLRTLAGALRPARGGRLPVWTDVDYRDDRVLVRASPGACYVQECARCQDRDETRQLLVALIEQAGGRLKLTDSTLMRMRAAEALELRICQQDEPPAVILTVGERRRG